MLRTKRLRLETLRVQHADLMYPGLLDSSLYTFQDDTPPASLEYLRARYAFLESARSPDGTEMWLNWIVFHQDGQEPIGYLQATVRPQALTEIAYVFFSPYCFFQDFL